MPWVRFDDQFTTHRKVNGLTDTEFRLHVEAIFWCARNLSDGRVGQDELDLVSRIRSPRKHVAKLVDRGLWHRSGQDCPSLDCPAHLDNGASNAVTGGWVVHDYFEYQPTKERVLREREDNARRQKKWREQHKQADASVSSGRRNAVSNTTPARPGPASVGGQGRGLPQPPQHERDPPPPPERCSEHADVPADGPCGPCGDARRTRRAWERDRAQEAAAERSAQARERAVLRRAEIENCNLCGPDGYLPTGRACTHDPDRVAGRGAAAARAALQRRTDEGRAA